MKYWDIPDAYWPTGTPEGDYVSHEAVCILNPTTAPAEVALTLYFEDRDPMTGFSLTVDAQRTRHVRMDRISPSPGTPPTPSGWPARRRNCRYSTPGWTPPRLIWGLPPRKSECKLLL